MQLSGIIPIFPVGIYKQNIGYIMQTELDVVNNFEFIQEKMYGGNIRTQNMDVLEYPRLKRIRDFIQKSVNVYSKEVLGTDSELHITISWINKNEPGSSHHIHNHPNSIISGVFYFKAGAPLTLHRNAQQNMIQLTTQRYNEFNSPTLRLPMEDGDLILFPSEMSHHVEQNDSNETRISLAFNTFVKGEIGSPELLTYLKI